MLTEVFSETRIDAKQQGRRLAKAIHVGRHATCSVQVVLSELSGTADAVFTVKVSNDGSTFSALPSSVTLQSGQITRVLDVSGYQYLQVEVTTASTAAAEFVSVHVACQSFGADA